MFESYAASPLVELSHHRPGILLNTLKSLGRQVRGQKKVLTSLSLQVLLLLFHHFLERISEGLSAGEAEPSSIIVAVLLRGIE
jgi:hypothetical protein